MKPKLCLLETDSRFLPLILIYLFAGFHKNISKPQNILNFYHISVKIAKIMGDNATLCKLEISKNDSKFKKSSRF